MPDWIISSFPELAKTFASSILVMAVTLLIIRFYGLRSLAKMSSVDFASTIAIGSILASVAINGNTSLLKGAVSIFTILGFQQIFSFFKQRSKRVNKIAENTPVFLMEGSTILHENLRKSGVTQDDLMAKLREANVVKLTEVKAVVFETTGDVSVLHGEKDKEVDEIILSAVSH